MGDRLHDAHGLSIQAEIAADKRSLVASHAPGDLGRA